MTDTHVVRTDNLTKRYGDFTALDGLSIHLEKGQILGFIGPNGAGKTTTIKILVGLAKPTEGSASICGADCVTEARKIKQLVGYMPDTFGSYDNMRVREYLDFFGAAFKIHRGKRGARIDEVMEVTGTTWLKDRYVEALSHGMKQRVGIARTLLHDPQVLILDEPANGLDPSARIEMRKILLRLAEMGKTLIVTSHILPELSRICDVVAIITHGKLRAFGGLDEIMRQITQRRTFEAQLAGSAGDKLHAAAGVISEHYGEEAEVTTSDHEGIVRFTTDRDDTDLVELLTKLVHAGAGVAQFREVVQDLEDAFMQVTKRDDRDVELMHVDAVASKQEIRKTEKQEIP